MKTIIFGLALLLQGQAYASGVSFNEIRSLFDDGKILTEQDFTNLEGKVLTCFNYRADGGGDFVRDAIKITVYKSAKGEKIIRNSSSDSRFKFDMVTSGQELVGYLPPSDKYQPVSFWKFFRSNGGDVIIEWANKPYTLETAIGPIKYGYNSPAAISQSTFTKRDQLIAEVYSLCK